MRYYHLVTLFSLLFSACVACASDQVELFPSCLRGRAAYLPLGDPEVTERLYQFEVGGAGDCGFHTLGIPRPVAIKLLIDNLDHITVRKLIAPELLDILLNARVDRWLPKQQLAQEIKASRNDYLQSIRTDGDPIIEVMAREILDRHSSSKELQTIYINYYLGRKRGYLESMENVGGNPATGLLDAIAHLSNLDVRIWRKHNGDNETLLLYHKTARPEPLNSECRTVYMRIKGEHFTRLLPASASAQEFSEALAEEKRGGTARLRAAKAEAASNIQSARRRVVALSALIRTAKAEGGKADADADELEQLIEAKANLEAMLQGSTRRTTSRRAQSSAAAANPRATGRSVGRNPAPRTGNRTPERTSAPTTPAPTGSVQRQPTQQPQNARTARRERREQRRATRASASE